MTAMGRTEWAYLSIAVLELALARMRYSRQPAQQIIQRLSADPVRSGGADGHPIELRDIERMRWAIGAAAARVPWRSDCLLQVMAADHWLRRKAATGSFHLGIAKEVDGRIRAHAWLTCSGIVVAGGSGEGLTPLIGGGRPQTPDVE
jgi:hypothetical protein